MAKIIWRDNTGVHVNPDFKAIPEYKKVYEKYKDGMKQILIYIYYVYNPEGIYSDMYPEVRKERVISKYSLPEDIEDDEDILALIEQYNECAKIREERFRDDVLRNMEDLLERIHKTPYEKPGKANVEGQTVTVMVDNSEEVAKLMKLAETLLNLSTKYRDMILKEKVKQSRKGQRKFDRPKLNEDEV